MKKLVLLLSVAVSSLAANAQLYCTGTSYSQNFDAISSALPSGWACYYGATSSALGSQYAWSGSAHFGAWYDTVNCAADVFGHGFKNSASYTGAVDTENCTLQQASTNRCLAVRQASNTTYPGYDPGPSFVLHLANTHGMTNVNLNFNLMSLDIMSPRVTAWTVDYGTGANPTAFTPVTTTPAALTTGGSTFASTPVTVSFGSALNNLSTDVWIRISTLAATTGSGNRTTSGIDDFNLTWTGTATTGVAEVAAANNLDLVVLGDATSDKVTLAYSTENYGNYSVKVYDITGRTIASQNVVAAAGNETIEFNGLNLAPGMYFAKMSNGTSASTVKIAIH